MSEQTRTSHPLYSLHPADIDGFESLVDLAMDMRWSWNHSTDEVWRQLDPELWDLTHHPCDVLQTVSREKIKDALADPAFRKKIDDLLLSKKQAEDAPVWFKQAHPANAAELCGVFQHGIHVERSLAYIFGRVG